MSASDAMEKVHAQDDDPAMFSNEETSPATTHPSEINSIDEGETPCVQSISVPAGLSQLESHLSVEVMSKALDPDPDFLMVFGVTAKAAAEIILQYLADKRSIENKKDRNAQVLQALEEVADVCEAVKENASAKEQIATYMATAEGNVLYAFYALLIIFPG